MSRVFYLERESRLKAYAWYVNIFVFPICSRPWYQIKVSSNEITFNCHLFNSVQIESDKLVIGILNNFHNNKKIKTLTDTNELIEHAVYAAAVEENSAILQVISTRKSVDNPTETLKCIAFQTFILLSV